MSVNFTGTAHPPAGKVRKTNADLNRAEIATTNLGKGGGTQLLLEHDHSNQVGMVTSSWEGRDGSLRVSGVVTDPDAVSSVNGGSTRGLSLGTSVLTDTDGKRLVVAHDELSVCVEPARAGCYIDTVNGQTVRQVACFSKKGE
jgi:hypothetical protein